MQPSTQRQASKQNPTFLLVTSKFNQNPNSPAEQARKQQFNQPIKQAIAQASQTRIKGARVCYQYKGRDKNRVGKQAKRGKAHTARHKSHHSTSSPTSLPLLFFISKSKIEPANICVYQ
jgi:hypothetical protein